MQEISRCGWSDGYVLSPTNDINISPTKMYNSNNNFDYTLPDQIDFEDYDNLFIAYEPFDLFIKDNYTVGHNDIGIEPNPDNGMMWVSGDIWARQDQNYNLPDETLEWTSDPNVYNYVFVRVHNNSCVDLPANSGAQVYLNWTKGATTMLWPNDWEDANTSYMVCSGQNLPLGGEVHPDFNQTGPNVQPIPAILAGQSAVLTFPWHIHDDPNLFLGCFSAIEYSHFCLIARIDYSGDPTGSVGQFVYDNAKNENNWAWKNISVMNSVPGIVHNEDCNSEVQQGGVVAVCNPADDIVSYDLEFKVEELNQGVPIFDQAEITATLDEITWQKWANGGFASDKMRILREDCRQILITGSPAFLKNLSYNPQEKTLMSLSFNFITENVDSTPEFDYDLIQHRSDNYSIVGGELYRIQKPSRYLFGADGGGDKTITSQESTQLTAQSIGEPAYYNWYDESGTLIYSGSDFTVNPDITTKYKLQVIAESDGFTSYDEVIVHVKDYQIKTISPNPATTDIAVEYIAELASSAYLSICPLNSNSSNNYIIDPSLHNTNLNLSGLLTGNYYLRLIVNGEIKDEMTFVIIQ